MKCYSINLDFDTFAGMDDDMIQEIDTITFGECKCRRVTKGSHYFDGYVIESTSLSALAAAYTRICGVKTLREAMEQGDPSNDLSTDEGVAAEFAEYYGVQG